MRRRPLNPSRNCHRRLTTSRRCPVAAGAVRAALQPHCQVLIALHHSMGGWPYSVEYRHGNQLVSGGWEGAWKRKATEPYERVMPAYADTAERARG